jgi:hypothetical protein
MKSSIVLLTILTAYSPALLLTLLLTLKDYYKAENKVKIKVRGLKYLYYKYKLRLKVKKIYKIYKINTKININLRLI